MMNSDKRNIFMKSIGDVWSGRIIYRKLKRRIHRSEKIYISQHPAIGDAFLIGSYLKRIISEKNGVITYIGNGAKEIYEMYGFSNLIELSQKQTNQLIKYIQFMEIAEDKVTILHYQALAEHTGILFQFNGVNQLCFADLLEKAIFAELSCEDRIYPTIDRGKKYPELVFGKSVIFFPYAKTLYTPKKRFWESLVDEERKTGKYLYTYVYGDEKPLKGTQAIRCDLKSLSGMAQYAGEIVGVRSGLMDLISQANCKKTIYYPSKGAESWISGRIIDFWSLHNFRYGTVCEEFEWEVNHDFFS